MPFVVNGGVRIEYEVAGDGPPLVLHHGFSGSRERWRQFGYVGALQPNYQLILLDSRGHGASDKPHDPAAYALPILVSDVVAILNALNLPQAHYLGYSMGGWIGFGVARYAPERVRSLLIGGAHPYRDSMWDAFRHVDGTKPDAFIAALEHVLGERITDDVKPRVIANDLRALSAAAQDRPSLDDVPQTMRIPCLLFVGEADARYSAVQQCAKQIMGATLRSFPGLTHVTTFMRSDQVLPHITQFLATVR